MNATHPIARLSAAEAALVASIDAATARLDAVGTTSLDAALSRLRDAAHAASARLADAGAVVASVVSDALERILGEATGIRAALASEAPANAPADESFAGYDLPEPTPEPAPRRTGFAVVDALLEVAAEAEADAHRADAPIEKYPAAPALFPPDGPTLFDRHGNAEADPTEVLVGPVAVPYAPGAPVARPGDEGDAEPVHPVASPLRKRRGR